LQNRLTRNPTICNLMQQVVHAENKS